MSTNLSSPLAPTSSGTVRKLLTRLVVTVAVIGGGWAAWHYWGQGEKQQQGRGRFARSGPQAVLDAVAQNGSIPITLNALGTVTPLATVTVKSQISGTLQALEFKEGQLVKAGDEIAKIDSRPYEATLKQQQAALAKDTATLAQAEADLKRYEALARQDSISTQQVSDQVFLVQQDKSIIASDEAQIQATELNINYTHVTAPLAGLAGLKQVDPGNYVTASDSSGIVVITQMQPMGVIFSVPEDSIAEIVKSIKANGPLPVTLRDRANVHEIAKGTLETYDNQIDTTTGTLKMRATIDNADGLLFPNQFVNVSLLIETLTNQVVVPAQAVQLGTSGNFVYVIGDDGSVKVTPVKTGAGDGTIVSITSGLQVGQHVVTDGTDQLRDGTKVVVTTAASVTTPESQHKTGSGHGRSEGAAGARAGSNGQKHHHKRPDDASGKPSSAGGSPAPSDTGGGVQQ